MSFPVETLRFFKRFDYIQASIELLADIAQQLPAPNLLEGEFRLAARI
jgi:hypothetical protein